MSDRKKLTILWTNADMDTSMHMVMMYAKNCMMNGWWESVTVIIWGATAKLVAENRLIQDEIMMAMHLGVQFSACIACARRLNVEEALEKQGIELKGWGEPLTTILKDDEKLLTI